NCLGALDGTYIQCLVPLEDKPRYRTRKNDIATNVLGVCSQDMQFVTLRKFVEVIVQGDVHRVCDDVARVESSLAQISGLTASAPFDVVVGLSIQEKGRGSPSSQDAPNTAVTAPSGV
ncbi:hypothetical protein Tco_0566735, partial [Tanacetum coccineum]